MPRVGWKHSAETRAHLSSVNVGRRHSAETKQKISDGQRSLRLGQKFSEEHKAKMAASRRGKRFTSEHCDNLSQALLDFYERTHPCGPIERARREARRQYKRALRSTEGEDLNARRHMNWILPNHAAAALGININQLDLPPVV